MDDLSGKVAVVTGAASGIGLALVERFGAESMSVVMADVEDNALQAAAQRVAASGMQVMAVRTDVMAADNVEALAAKTIDRFGAVHVVCNNAGVSGHMGRVWETSPQDWAWVLGVNLWGVIHGVRAFVPKLIDQGEGHIVNTASVASWWAPPSQSAYSASKHAVLALTEALRRELDAAKSGIGVSALCPGLVNTQIMTSSRNWPDHLGEEPAIPTDPLSSAVRTEVLAGSTGGGIDPTRVAEAVVDGIRQNQFIIAPTPDEVVAAAERRLEAAKGAPPRRPRQA